jgi:hypothetical protein
VTELASAAFQLQHDRTRFGGNSRPLCAIGGRCLCVGSFGGKPAAAQARTARRARALRTDGGYGNGPWAWALYEGVVTSQEAPITGWLGPK